MNIKRIIALIKADTNRVEGVKTAKRYYNNDSDIIRTGVNSTTVEKIKDNILRNADNRVSHSFHTLLTNEKAAYLFTYPPTIDIDDDKNNLNSVVDKVLGESFTKKLKILCVESTNAGVAWLHYWVDDEGFNYEKVDTEECIPIYSNSLNKKLIAFIRYYNVSEYKDETTAEKETFLYIEYWDDKQFVKYKLKEYSESPIETDVINHTFGKVPFIKFANSVNETSDLIKYKKQIDLYDKVMSGYANDIEDVQQIIYILENYGGDDEGEFIKNLKRYKTVQLANNEIEGKGDLRTLQIDIPVEARKLILEVIKKQIYEFGQGLQQDIESYGNASGVALKFFYRKLELKSGDTETEFREGVQALVEAILNYLGVSFEKIQQVYTRNMISNDLEKAQIAAQSVGIIPQKNILQNHPWIDDVDEATNLLKEEREEKERKLEESYSFDNPEGDVDE